jgi:hypothetical protein
LCYSLSGLLKSLRELPYKPTPGRATEINGVWTAPIDATLCHSLREETEQVTRSFQVGLTSYFRDSSEKLFRETALSITVSDEEMIACAKSAEHEVAFYVSSLVNYAVRRRSTDVVVRLEGPNGDHLAPSPPQALTSEMASSMILRWYVKAVVGDPFLLPAERAALPVTYRALVGERSRESSSSASAGYPWLTSDQRSATQRWLSSSYPEPVIDFLQFLYDEGQLPQYRDNNELLSTAEYIEQHLQDDNRTRYRQFGPRFELAVDVNDKSTSDSELSATIC